MFGSSSTNLGDLPSEVLLAIFKYLYKSDLLNLRLTCWRFNSIINSDWDILLFQRRESFHVTNQKNEDIRNRSEKILHAFDKHRISTNWKNGAYEENNYLLFKKYISCLYLEKDLLWLGRGDIKAYERRGCNINFYRPRHTLNGFKPSHTCKFVINNGHILTGNEHNLRLYSIKNEKYIFNMNLHDLDISSVDMKSELIAVGSRNNKVYLYRNTYKSNPLFCCKEVLEDRIWSVALNSTKLAIGTAANNSLTSIFVFDVNTHTLIRKIDTGQRGAGILNLKWDESSHSLWSGGYDSFLRRWDLREGKLAQNFEDPFLSMVYSFDYDFNNTCITGCEGNGRAVLWDTRKNKYIQIYYLQSCRKSSSPIYSLSFEPKYLFAVTELHMNVLDFSVVQGTSQDYSDIFHSRIVI